MESLEQTRISNVTEYLIHIYQAEELLREYNFDLGKLANEHLEGKEKEQAWYADLAATMESDGVKDSGHIASANAVAKELSEIHFHLLKSDRTYRGHFDQAKLHINRHMAAHGGDLQNPIQMCLDGIFLFKHARANQQSVDEQALESMQAFNVLCSYLGYRYKAKHEGE